MKYSKQLAALDSQIGAIRGEICKAQVVNEQRNMLEQRLKHLQESATELQSDYKAVCFLEDAALAEDAEYKNKRKAFLENIIDENLSIVFPEKKLRADLECDFKYKHSKIKFRLREEDGTRRKPSISEGGLYQYALGFSAAVGTVVGLGCSNVFIDEAFGVGSGKRLPAVGNLLSGYVNSGVQMLAISQNSALYDSIPRKIFHLSLDEEENKVNIDSIEVVS